MDLSKDTIRLLRWMRRNDQWLYLNEIEKRYKKFDYRSFQALNSAKFIDECIFESEVPEYDEYGQHYYPSHFRISDKGKAYLESRILRTLPERRGWVAIIVSIFALVVSIISLIWK